MDENEESINYNETITFVDSDNEDMDGMVVVSEETQAFLTKKFTQSVTNESRLKTQRCFPLPKVAATRTPQLDCLVHEIRDLIHSQNC